MAHPGPRKWLTDEAYKARNERIYRLVQSGRMTFEQVASEYGLTRQRVQQIIVKGWGYKPGHRELDTDQKRANKTRDLLIAWDATRMNDTEIAEKYGLSSYAIRVIRLKAGVRRKGPPRHGTHYMYSSKQHRCRCELCRAAIRKYHAERIARTPIPDRVHGTPNGYTNWACRCDRCRAAGSLQNKKTGERRKLREGRTHEQRCSGVRRKIKAGGRCEHTRLATAAEMTTDWYCGWHTEDA